MYRKSFFAKWFFLSLFSIQCINMCFASDIEQARNNITVLINSGQLELAPTKVNNLLSDYSQDPELPRMIYKIAGSYDVRWDTSSAKQLYLHLIRNFPENVYADKAKLDITRLSIESEIDGGNFSTAKTYMEQMILKNSGNANLPRILYHIAGRYKKCKKDAEAKLLYNRIVRLFPKDEVAHRSKLDIARLDTHSLIVSGKLDMARSLIDTLISDSPKDEYLAKALLDAGEDYTKQYSYDEAKALYTKLINLYPIGKYSSQASLELVALKIRSAIDSKNFGTALSLTNQLIEDNKANSSLSPVLYSVMRHYAKCKEAGQAKVLCSKLKELCPDSYDTYRSKLDAAAIDVFSSIESGDFAHAEELTESLIGSHCNHPYLGEILFDIGSCYCENSQYGRAKTVCNYLIEHYPKNYNSTRAKVEIPSLDICSQITTGDFAANQSQTCDQLNTAIEQFRQNFKENPNFSRTMNHIAQAYYLKGVELDQASPGSANILFKKSISIIENDILGSVSDISAKTSAYYVIGLNRNKLAEYQKAAEAFQYAAEINPHFKHADYCVFAKGYCYKKLLSNNMISESEAKPIITSQYTKVLANYPHSKYASYVSEWLQNNK